MACKSSFGLTSTCLSEPMYHLANFYKLAYIFTDAAYVVNDSPIVCGEEEVQIVVANGVDEVLWLGAENVKMSDFVDIIAKMQSIFADTLDGIEMKINAFVINPVSEKTDGSYTVKRFSSVENAEKYASKNLDDVNIFVFDSALEAYKFMQQRRCVDLVSIPDSGLEDFTAQYEYISTVVEFMQQK